MSLEDRTAEDLAKTGELEEFEKLLWDEFEKHGNYKRKQLKNLIRRFGLQTQGRRQLHLVI